MISTQNVRKFWTTPERRRSIFSLVQVEEVTSDWLIFGCDVIAWERFPDGFYPKISPVFEK